MGLLSGFFICKSVPNQELPIETAGACAGACDRPFKLELTANETVSHWPVLGMLQGDTPFMERLFKLVGHGSYGPCYRCCLEGSHIAGAVRCVWDVP
jgi:hypothetical protein